MIMLTSPVAVPSSIGGTAKTNYDKMRVVSINADPMQMTINAQVQLMVSNDPKQPTISGNLSFIATNGLNPVASLQIPSLNFFCGIDISQLVQTVQGWITALQNSIESGLVSQGAVAGTQSTGT